MTKVLEKINETVKKYLIAFPDTRNSDNALYYRIISDICHVRGIREENLSIRALLLDREELGFPKYETIRRSRQKVQAENPELRADKEVQEARQALQEEWKEWAVI